MLLYGVLWLPSFISLHNLRITSLGGGSEGYFFVATTGKNLLSDSVWNTPSNEMGNHKDNHFQSNTLQTDCFNRILNVLIEIVCSYVGRILAISGAEKTISTQCLQYNIVLGHHAI